MVYTSFDLIVGDGPVAEIVLNRPDKRNALTLPFWEEFPAAVTEIDEQPHIRALIIRSEGPHFSAGMDLSFFTGIDAHRKEAEEGRFREWLRREILRLQDALTVLETTRVPVICAVQGGCIGGALDLICAANIRYASQDAFFSIHEINVGMTADVGTLQRLPKIIPAGYVHEMALTGQKVSAEQAKQMGLVTAVLPTHEEAVEHARSMAALISEKSPLAIVGTKVALNHSRDHSVAEGLAHMSTWNAGMFISEDLSLGLEAQKEKRLPEYKDTLVL